MGNHEHPCKSCGADQREVSMFRSDCGACGEEDPYGLGRGASPFPPGAHAAAVDAARRESLTPHQRATEDVVDEYTRAVQANALQEWFERVAAARIQYEEQRSELRDARERAEVAAAALRTLSEAADAIVRDT